MERCVVQCKSTDVPPKRRWTSNGVHVTPQKIIFIVTAMRATNPAQSEQQVIAIPRTRSFHLQ
jgi:hypothetical protein